HVDAAALMLSQRLSLPLPPNPNKRPDSPTHTKSNPKKPGPPPKAPASYDFTQTAAEDYATPDTLDETEHFAPAPLVADPYREDDAPIEHEWESLRLPAGRDKPIISSRGAVIGVEPSRSLHDVAITATLLEAAKYRAIRR